MKNSISPDLALAIAEVVQTVHRLRAPGGCPWDMKQTHQSLRPYVIEEAYEVLEILDQIDSSERLKTDPHLAASLREELGDLLMQVLIHSELASETGTLDFASVARALNAKLIHRHPHVFGENASELKGLDADGVLKNWEKIKAEEKAKKSAEASVLDGLPKGLPALQRTSRLIDKVTRVGFQWPNLDGPLEKLKEELGEFETEVKNLQGSDSQRQKAQQELGDLLFSLCNVAFLLKLDPEEALRGTLSRFESRFRHVESRLRQQGKRPEDSTLEEMDRYWEEAKRQATTTNPGHKS